MPEISRFFGVVIRMFAEPGGPHHRPHFHAYYQDSVAIIAIDKIEVIAGHLPTRQQRLVEAWAEIHLSELIDDWSLLQSGHAPEKIEPLRWNHDPWHLSSYRIRNCRTLQIARNVR